LFCLQRVQTEYDLFERFEESERAEELKEGR